MLAKNLNGIDDLWATETGLGKITAECHHWPWENHIIPPWPQFPHL